ncbi:MAG: SMP-30/gluconolactonase/LRE family protein [Thermomicrobiales bacterium]
MSWTFETLAEFPNLLEGPLWDGSGLLFTECDASRIHRYDPTTGRCTVYREGTNKANGLLLGADGALYACEGEGRRVVRYDGSTTTVVADGYDGGRLNSPNDLVSDGQGRIWFSDPRYGPHWDDLELGHESVYRADPHRDGGWSLTRVTFDTTRPNGVLLSADERTLYVAQSEYGEGKMRELWAYPIAEDGSLGPRRVLHTFYPHRGIDGMCLDSVGNIVATAGWRESGPGPMIYVFAPDGRVLEQHPVPVDRPTNCTWGEDDLRTLYVTTGSGYLLRARTDRQGHPRYRPPATTDEVAT